MFQPTVPKSSVVSLFATLELIFHVAVRDIRKSNGNAIVGLLLSIVQSLTMVMFFWFMFAILHMRGSAVRGDFMLYSMSGIFMYMTHIRTIKAVSKAEGPTSAMMKHAPMNTIVAISGQALAALYQQFLSIVVILFFYHTLFNPVQIEDVTGALAMFLLAWASGVGVGMIFKAATPWAPDFFGVLTSVYTRANMIASGKMFLANALPTSKLFWFSWNPLFHIIDQSRGFVFLNYNPHYSNITYPVVATFVLIILGLMGDTFTRQYASASWSAGK
ncbi:MAG: ABC transporter permease [Pseudorhodobacter sp.]|nr:ABC transporter permease [Pseudorhodobacter sp.]